MKFPFISNFMSFAVTNFGSIIVKHPIVAKCLRRDIYTQLDGYYLKSDLVVIFVGPMCNIHVIRGVL